MSQRHYPLQITPLNPRPEDEGLTITAIVPAGRFERAMAIARRYFGNCHILGVMNQRGIRSDVVLLPCPFCGSADLKIENLVDRDDYFVSCNGCQIQQIANYTRREAVRRWNRRAGGAA